MDLFVAETPLQMINALEARSFFKCNHTSLILLTSPAFPDRVFKPLVEAESWSSIVSIPIREKEPEYVSYNDNSIMLRKINEYYRYLKQFKARRKFNSIAKSVGKINRLFLGNYLQDYMRHLGNRIDYRELVLLDDGTDAVRVNESRRHRGNVAKARGFSGFKAKLHRKLHEWDPRHVDNLTFFSAYDFVLHDGDQLIKNEYLNLRKKISLGTAKNRFMFLGQCLVDDEWMSKKAYLTYLERIKQYYGNEELVYVKHPRESKSILDQILTELNFQIVSFEVPIEFQLVKEGVAKEIASFFCSAIENCRIIFGSSITITAFYIESRDLLCCHDFVNQIYAQWKLKENDHFRVIAV